MGVPPNANQHGLPPNPSTIPPPLHLDTKDGITALQDQLLKTQRQLVEQNQKIAEQQARILHQQSEMELERMRKDLLKSVSPSETTPPTPAPLPPKVVPE